MTDRAQLSLLLVAILLSGCTSLTAPPGPPDTATKSPTEQATTEVPQGEEIQQTIRFDHRTSQLTDVAWPIEVKFQRLQASNWTAVRVFNLDRMEPVVVDLQAKEQYRIVVEDSDGNVRDLGIYTPIEPNANRTIVISGCCVDDFE